MKQAVGKTRIRKWTGVYFGVAALCLFYAALSKGIAVARGFNIMGLNDPVFMVRNAQLVIGVACIEVAVATYLTLSNELGKRSVVLFGLAGHFLLYRFFLARLAPGASCKCFSALGSWLPFTQGALDLLAWIVLCYFLIGSVLILFLETRNCISQANARDQ